MLVIVYLCDSQFKSIPMIKQIVFVVVFFSFHSLCAQVDNYSAGLNGQKLDWLMYYIQDNYVDSMDIDVLTDQAIRRVVTELDSYSKYQTKEEVEEQTNNDKGYSGKSVGFSFFMLHDTVVVTYVHSGGPAEKAGLLRGDQIVMLDNKSIISKKEILQTAIDDKEVEKLSLGLKRNGYDQKVNVTKDLVPWLSVNSGYMMDQRIGYIKVGKFTLKTMEEFMPSLRYLQSLGMQELILDLRGNNGGVRDQALAMADVFLSEGKTVYYTDGHNLDRDEFVSTSGGTWETGKVVILQDAYTASASEIFIAAMQEWDRAVVLGVSTYGKGLIQQSYKLGDGSNIRFTVGRYYTPTGRHLQRTTKNNNDFMVPYKEALLSNSLTAHLSVPDSLKSKTMNGRLFLAGPGGIIPDIYYEFDDKRDWNFYNTINNAGHLYTFTTDYVQRNRRELLKQYKSVKSFSDDRYREAFMLKEFRTYLKTNEPALVIPANFPENVIHQIKTWIVSQLWHDNAFYEMDNMDDRLLFRAKEIINGKVHENLGISY